MTHDTERREGEGVVAADLPPGDYAIVELFGHTTLVGRIAEVERFGTKMLAIEPLFNGEMLAAVFYGGSAIYGLTPCSAEIAASRSPRHLYHLPAALRSVLPPAMLPPVEPALSADAEHDDGIPF